jgi:hypothetical protein
VPSLTCFVDSDDKDFFPVTKKVRGNFADVDALMGEVATQCDLTPGSFRVEAFSSEVPGGGGFIELDDLSDLEGEVDKSVGTQKRKRDEAEEISQGKKVKLRLVPVGGRDGGVDGGRQRRGIRMGGADEQLYGERLQVFDSMQYNDRGPQQYGVNLGVMSNRGSSPTSNRGLDSEGGVNWHLPPQNWLGTKEPTMVYTQLTLEQLGNIDTAKCTVYVRLTMTLYWDDPRLKEFHELGSPLPSNVWSPAPRVKEEIQGKFEVDVMEFARMSEEEYAGHVHKVVRYGGMITNPMDLRMFPFDHDDIEVTFLGNACSTPGQVQRSLFHTACTHPHTACTHPHTACTHPHTACTRLTRALYASSPPPPPLPGRQSHERQLQNRLPPAVPGTVQCVVQCVVQWMPDYRLLFQSPEAFQKMGMPRFCFR